MRLGTALAEVTQIGKICHSHCAIYELAGDCVMPREGIFVRILEPGTVRAGSPIEILGQPEDNQAQRADDTAPHEDSSLPR